MVLILDELSVLVNPSVYWSILTDRWIIHNPSLARVKTANKLYFRRESTKVTVIKLLTLLPSFESRIAIFSLDNNLTLMTALTSARNVNFHVL